MENHNGDAVTDRDVVLGLISILAVVLIALGVAFYVQVLLAIDAAEATQISSQSIVDHRVTIKEVSMDV